MLIKITQPGWETFTGEMGGAQFENAVSTDHVSKQTAYALGSYLSVMEVDAAGNELGIVNHAHDLWRAKEVSAEVVAPRKRLSDIQAEEEAAAKAAAETAGQDAPAPTRHTQATLEAIAADKGISGIREIAEPLGIKGTAIRTLISEILARQPGN